MYINWNWMNTYGYRFMCLLYSISNFCLSCYMLVILWDLLVKDGLGLKSVWFIAAYSVCLLRESKLHSWLNIMFRFMDRLGAMQFSPPTSGGITDLPPNTLTPACVSAHVVVVVGISPQVLNINQSSLECGAIRGIRSYQVFYLICSSSLSDPLYSTWA